MSIDGDGVLQTQGGSDGCNVASEGNRRVLQLLPGDYLNTSSKELQLLYWNWCYHGGYEIHEEIGGYCTHNLGLIKELPQEAGAVTSAPRPSIHVCLCVAMALCVWALPTVENLDGYATSRILLRLFSRRDCCICPHWCLELFE
ncbi:hypothetical protein QTG54_009197 [Skeletonema marinoi]|uniref:Uncharacterized protein n=1 Tax=Skeletonema marinoi TaxID=267567 RepID=A0AAD9DAK2_9STRA|nr:hypothetical protein QTG54_009197 [Skeletonema marinoi]